MKDKKIVAALVFVLVIIIAGASILYSRLAGSDPSSGLLVVQSPSPAPDRSTDQQADQDTSHESDQDTDQDPGQEEEDGLQAIDFTVTDREGGLVNLSDFIGKPIVLNFWASWCGPCKNEMPYFNESHMEYDGEVIFLMINMTDGSRETVDTASEYIDNQGFSFPVYYDTDSQAAIAYSVTSLPTSYFIDADGYIVARAIGAINEETLKEGIGMILPDSSEEKTANGTET